MRKLAAQCLVAVALVVMAVPAHAQTDLTDSRTVEQKFARIQFGAAFLFAGLVSQERRWAKPRNKLVGPLASSEQGVGVDPDQKLSLPLSGRPS